jgi:hypothetical protein
MLTFLLWLVVLPLILYLVLLLVVVFLIEVFKGITGH